MLRAGKHVRIIGCEFGVFLIEVEHVDFIADGPARIVVLFLTNEAESLLNNVLRGVHLLIKIAKIDRTEATELAVMRIIIEHAVNEVLFSHFVKVDKLLSVRTFVIVLEANHRVSGSVTRLVITEARAIVFGLC